MTSRYRAAQRAVELFNALQGEGLTTDEIAAELRRRGALDRKSASDPAADLLANVRDMVADFAKAMGQPLAEDALRARAEAAERRAEAAEAEVGCLRAELAVMPRPEDRCHGAWPCEASTALASAEAEAARWEARAEAMAAELAQARADRALLAGLWLGAVAPRVLPAILPADPGDRERLVAALDAVNLQPSAEACIAAGRAVIARIVA